MPDPIYLPSNEEFKDALVAFVLVSGSVAYHRGREFGPTRLGEIARELSHEFESALEHGDVEAALEEFDQKSRVALGALFEELVYIAHKYKDSARDADVHLHIPGPSATYFAEEIGNVFSDDTIDDIETVKGSLPDRCKRDDRSSPQAACWS